MKKSFLFIFLSVFCLSGYAQIDTEFWFACPDLTADHQSQDAISLNFVSYEQPTVIRIIQPSNPNFTPVTRTMGAHEFYTFSLKNHLKKVETVANGQVQNTGFYITSTNPVTVYYAATSQNSEIYTLKGKNALGNEFTVPMQFNYECKENGYSSIEIVATEDNTSVTIITRVPTNVSAVPGTITVPLLNRGQSYAIRSADKNTTGANHLHNTKIISDKPIAVNTTDDSATTYDLNNWGDKDLVGDQLVPERLIASKYIAVSNLSNHEYAFISAVQENTTVYIYDNNGERELVTLDPGEEFGCALQKNSGTLFYTKDEKPFILFQLTASGGELGGSILPNLDCSGSSEVSYKRTLGDQIEVTVLTRTENTGAFTVNGSERVITESMFIPVPGDPSWSYTVAEIPGEEQVKIKNSLGTFHLGIFDYKGGTCSYGYFSNYGNIPLQFTTNQSYYMEGESIRFSLFEASTLTDIKWTGPRGVFGIGEVSPVLNDVTAADAGMYIVEANHKDGCEVSPDTFFVNILQQAGRTEIVACAGDPVVLESDGLGDVNGEYEWKPEGQPGTKQITVTPDVDSEYTVKNYKRGDSRVVNGDFTEESRDFKSDYTYGGTGSGALDSPGTYVVGGNPKQYGSGLYDIEEHTDNDGNQFMTHVNAGEAVVWQQNISNLVPGTRYELSAWFTAAKKNDVPLKLRYKINDVISNIFVIQNNEQWNFFNYEWICDESSATVSIITVPSTPGGSIVCIDDIGFSPLLQVVDTFHVTLLEFLEPEISGDTQLCKGTATLTANDGFESYEWNTGETSQTITVTEAGVYSVTVKMGTCEGSASFTVLPAEKVEFTLGDIPQICSGDMEFGISYTAVSGELGMCGVTFDEKAKEAGFIDNGDLLISGDQIIVNIPFNVRPDIYQATLILTDEKCGDSNEIPIEFTIRYSKDILAQRWNDVLGVKNATYNGGYIFTEYQWYKNGVPMSGCITSYIYEKDYFRENDSYSVLLTRDDGVKIFTCDFYPEKIGDGKDVPTVVVPAQVIDLNTDGLSGTAVVLNNLGQIMCRQDIGGQNQSVRMPTQQGLYLLNICLEGESRSHKILVK